MDPGGRKSTDLVNTLDRWGFKHTGSYFRRVLFTSRFKKIHLCSTLLGRHFSGYLDYYSISSNYSPLLRVGFSILFLLPLFRASPFFSFPFSNSRHIIVYYHSPVAEAEKQRNLIARGIPCFGTERPALVVGHKNH